MLILFASLETISRFQVPFTDVDRIATRNEIVDVYASAPRTEPAQTTHELPDRGARGKGPYRDVKGALKGPYW